MTHPTGLSILAVAVVIFAAAPALAADKPGQGKGRGAKDQSEQSAAINISVDIGLGDSERRIVRDYYSAQKSCPPGLARKNNGCLPPGIAKKRYEVGRPVLEDAIIIELPHDVIVRLPPLPSGHGYRMVDGDLVIVALSTMIVLDAIGLI
ncbi:MAG: hypothetical protein AB7P23_07055 [Amphiplicatus sp.]